MRNITILQIDKKTIVIGLDGATFDLIKPWLDTGKLPNLGYLVRKGIWGNLKSVTPTTSAPAWVSFATGKNPGKHGVFDFLTIPDTQNGQSRLVSSLHFKDKTLWEILSLHNKKVGVVNVPMTYPPKAVNGFMISCFMTPPSAKIFTYPEELMKEITDYRIDTNYARQRFGLIPENRVHLLEEQYDITEKRASAVLKLMDKWETDFFIVVFKGTDNIQHYFWDRKVTLLKYYQKMDEIIGRILAKASENTNVFIISDHGFGPSATKKFFINAWLEQLGFLKRKKSLISCLFQKVYGILWQINRKTHIVKRIPKKNIVRVMSTLNQWVDWTKTRAYSPTIFGIIINLKGRDHNGTVEPGQEYEKTREEIIGKLINLTDPDTGGKIMAGVYRNDELYWGNNTGKAPDIICVPDPKYSITNKMNFTDNILVESQPELPGDHHAQPNGILIAFGPDIKQGEKIIGAELIDITPTILRIMDTPIPKDMDGKVLKEIFSGNSEFAKRDIVYEEIDERTKIKEKTGKLKNLGKL